MMTRDHWLFKWPVVVAALVPFVLANFEMIHQMFPGMTERQDAWVRFGAMALLTAVAKMGMSPLPISPEGRTAAIKTNAALAGSAQRAVAQASVEMGKAAVATDKAADAAVEAKKAVDKVG